MLYFFLSYAHGDNSLVARFFEDLCLEICAYTGRDPDQPDQKVGFLDDELQVGASWPPDLIDALAVCQTFVALCSPRYFHSVFCGREWTVFAGRLAEYTKATGRRAPALIPLFWVPTDVPSHLGDIQHRDKTFGAAYHADGLRALMRLPENHSDYLRFVTALAKRIRSTAEEHDLPPLKARPDLWTVPSAFHESPAGAVEEQPGQSEGGPPAVDLRTKFPPRPILKYEPPDPPDNPPQ